MALTISEELHEALFSYSEVAEKPASTLAAMMLEELIDEIKAITNIVKLSKEGNKAGVKKAVRHLVGDQMASLMKQHQDELEKAKKARK